MSSLTLIIAIFCFAIIVIIALTLLSRRGGGIAGHGINDDLLKSLEKKDPLWNKETLMDAVKGTFDVLKKSYETKKSDVDNDVMTINIYRDLFSKMIPNMEKLSFIKHASLKDTEIIRIEAHKTEGRNSFTVKLTIEGNLPEGEKPSVYWTFVRSSKKWLLSEISEDPVQAGFYNHA
jgi:hypothetical protein